jgi:hypothetical protein
MNDTYFIIVETHNGCDLRCGYSDGMVYEIKDIYSYFGSEFIEYCTDESYFDSIQNEWTFDSDKKAFFTSDGEEVRIYGGGI